MMWTQSPKKRDPQVTTSHVLLSKFGQYDHSKKSLFQRLVAFFEALSSAAQASNFGISPMDKLCTRCASVGGAIPLWPGVLGAKTSLEIYWRRANFGGGLPIFTWIHSHFCWTNSPSIWIWIDCMSNWFFVLFRTKQLPPYPFWMETLAHFVASLDGNSCSQIGLMTFPHHSASHSKVSRFEPEWGQPLSPFLGSRCANGVWFMVLSYAQYTVVQ